MAFSRFHQTLYRSAGRVVILAASSLLLVPGMPGQFARREPANKGPRALGLLELAGNGKGRLIPVTVMYDGKFFDAGAYKATPVPMALETDTVYEAVRTGVSQGLFTVTGALRRRDSWLGEGTWRSASEIAVAEKKQATPAKPAEEDSDKPPRLRRPSPESAKPSESVSQKPPAVSPAPTAPTAAPTAPPAKSSPAAPPAAKEDDDKDRPVLRRGKPAPTSSEPLSDKATAPAAASPAPAAAGSAQLIPAISDAGGPEPRSFAYPLKPDEEQLFRKKMLALAADEVRARAQLLASEVVAPSSSAASRRVGAVTKPSQPSFEDVLLQVFDLSSSNEAVLVLTAKARMSQTNRQKAVSELDYYVTLVARDDLYGELRKAFSSVTDTLHLDARPRMELIDAVDADGDGRGELLFRRVSAAGSAYEVYRVIGDRLYAIFQGTPGQ